MKTYTEIVQLLSEKLSKEDFLCLEELVDGDAYDEFSEALSMKAAELAPELFIDPNDDEELKKLGIEKNT